MHHLFSKAEINPPQDPIHLPDLECPCQYHRHHALLPLASPNFNPVQMCSVSLTLCSLPSHCRGNSLQSKIQSCTLPSLSHSHLICACPAHALCALLCCSSLPTCKQGPSTIPALSGGTALSQTDPPPVCRITGVDPRQAGLVWPGQVAAGTWDLGQLLRAGSFGWPNNDLYLAAPVEGWAREARRGSVPLQQTRDR